MENYFKNAGKALMAGCLTYDMARAAEKMGDLSCVGEDNEAWKVGPYISSGANEKQIDRNRPYCYCLSKETSVAAGLVLGPNPAKDPKNGGVLIPLPTGNQNISRVEPVISKLIIIEQIELFKEFLNTFAGPSGRAQSRNWQDNQIVGNKILEHVTTLIDRRNALTHDQEYDLPTMKEAVDFYYEATKLAPVLYDAKQKYEASKLSSKAKFEPDDNSKYDAKEL